MKKEKVLLVDDEQEFVHALSKRMTKRGLDVITASSGNEALTKVESENFDAVVLDLMMPDMDGLETLKRMLKKNPELQIILLTGHATIEKGIEAVKLGAVDFMTKPADIEQLIKRIHQAKTNKMVLVEKKMEAKLTDILKSKEW